MERSSSRTGNSSVASQISCNLSNLNFHYRVRNSPPLVLVLIRTNSRLTTYVETNRLNYVPDIVAVCTTALPGLGRLQCLVLLARLCWDVPGPFL
jgi:hypothetical protein